MARIAKLDSEIMKAQENGYKVFGRDGGKIAPETKCSNLYRMIKRARKAGYETVDYVVGARRRFLSEGCWFAVIVK